MNWDKLEHNFGEVKSPGVYYTEFKYLGDKGLSQSNFSSSCGCTTPQWDTETNTLKVGLSVSQVGGKQSTVTVSGFTTEILILKAIGT